MKNEHIKYLSIKDYLSEQGIFPAKMYSSYAMYKSPFRDERTPSFKVDFNANLWYDFGISEGGSIIDLVMKMKQYSFIQAVRLLEEKTDFPRQVKTAFSSPEESVGRMILTKANQNIAPHLEQYLKSRSISMDAARKFLKTVYYQINGDIYNALGFPNNAGGYELRNSRFKGCFPPKEITTFDRQTSNVNLFEGFMDYLSLLTLQTGQADVSAVVLNSITNLDRAVPFLSKHERINAFLDNDEAGKQALEKLQKRNLPIVDISKRYADFKDVNDYLCGKKLEIQQTKQKTKRLKF